MDTLVYNDTGLSINQQLSNIKGDLTAANVLGNTLLSNTTAYAGSLNTHIKALEGVTDELDGRVETLEGFYDAIDNMADSDNGAALHNWIYRGKNLGTSLTSTQIANIADGTFKDIFAGDYWEKSITFSYPDYSKTNDALTSVTQTVRMIVGECDYRYMKGPDALITNIHVTQHHVLAVPRYSLFFAPFNAERTNTGGYVGAKMYTVYLQGGLNAFNAFFGSSHLLKHWQKLVNAVDETTKNPSGWGNYQRTVDLMTSAMVFGWWRPEANCNVGYDTTQLAAFRLNPRLMFNDTMSTTPDLEWFRDTSNGGGFNGIYHWGLAGGYNAKAVHGVRPAALIV